MHVRVLGALAALGCLFAYPVHAANMPQQDAAALEQTAIGEDLVFPDRDLVEETELYCLTLAVYFEGGSTGESEIGQRHIARVVHERAKANRRVWGGSTICGVVFYKRMGVCQFSFACLPLARRTPAYKGPAWRMSEAVARSQLEGDNENPDRLIRYYMNEELTPLKNACRFRKEFVPVGKVGRHDFFREPTSWERRELAKSEPAVCKRYAAALKAKKSKAAKKATAAKLKAAKLKAKKQAAIAAKKKKKAKRAKVAKR